MSDRRPRTCSAEAVSDAARLQVAADALRSIEANAISCLVCGLSGVRRDAVTVTLIRDGFERPSCSEHAWYPAVMNGEDQIDGLIPIEQPRHVVIAREALARMDREV